MRDKLFIKGTADYAWQDETINYLSMSALSAAQPGTPAQKKHFNQLIKDLKDGGVWSRLDALWLLANWHAADPSLIALRSLQTHLDTGVYVPDYTATDDDIIYSQYKTAESYLATSVIQTDFEASETSKYGLTDASFVFFFPDGNRTGRLMQMGSGGKDEPTTWLNVDMSIDINAYQSKDPLSVEGYTYESPQMLIIQIKVVSNVQRLQLWSAAKAVDIADIANCPMVCYYDQPYDVSEIPDDPFRLFNNASLTNEAINSVALWGFGASLTEAQMNALNTAYQTYYLNTQKYIPVA